MQERQPERVQEQERVLARAPQPLELAREPQPQVRAQVLEQQLRHLKLQRLR